MDLFEYNRNAWNLQSLEGCRWSTPYPDEVIERAKRGDWSVILTPNRAVPRDWFPAYPDLGGLRILALASGGGQQVPVFAAAGAEVTSFDGSDVQLEKDEETCARHGLRITAIREFRPHLQPGFECLRRVARTDLARMPPCSEAGGAPSLRVHESGLLPLRSRPARGDRRDPGRASASVFRS
jgi:hypothetical protein